MSARRLTRSLQALALVALVLGCSKSTAPRKPITLNVTLNGFSWPISATNVAPFPSGTGCATYPAVWRQTGLVMTGTSTGLGAASMSVAHCNSSTSAAGVLTSISVDGAGTMTVANGDQAAFTYSLGSFQVVSATVLNVVFPLTFTGGTGQFLRTTGTGTMTCVRTTPVDPTTLPAHSPAFANAYACTMNSVINPTP